ncbi:MAG TPA: GNAT family N-acetyltransferase [Gaiellaceae bacterium]|nr:GNAT family N-acetyltransferase [Gaiellaceae bacterium]
MSSIEQFHGWLTGAFAELVRQLPDARFEQRDGYIVIAYPSFPVPSFNGIWANGNNDLEASTDLEAVIAEIDASGAWPGVTTHDDLQPNLIREAKRLGLTDTTALPAMTVSPDRLQVPTIDARLEKANDPDGRAVALDLAARGFGAPAEWLSTLYGDDLAAMPGIDYYLASADDQPVSTAISYIRSGTVGIFNVATPTEHRGHGYAAAITAYAIRQSFTAGAGTGWLQSSPMAEAVYSKLGFERIGAYTVHARPSPARLED